MSARRHRALAAVALLVAALGAACGERRAGDLAGVRARGELTWGADLQGGEPYAWEDPDHPGRLLGFEVEIMDAVARRLGVKARMVHAAWSSLVPSLERGDFDLVFNGLEATPERQRRLRLSAPYFTFAETLAVRRGSPYRGLADLAGKRVATLNETTALALLRTLPVEPVLYEGDEEPYLDLELGRVDAVLLDDIIATRYGCVRPGVACLPGEIARGTYVAAMRPADAALAAAFDDALAGMRRDGELEAILRRAGLWSARQAEPPPPIAEPGAPPDAPPGAPPGARPGARGFDGEQLRRFLVATGVTLGISVLAFLLAVPVGAGLAVARVFGGPVARGAARAYIELFRGTPVLLQLFLLYYGLAGVVNLSPMTAAVLGLGLNYGAYEAEVYRGALLAIPRGQAEAARALGLSPWQTLRHVLLPQALRLALPPMTNDFVSLLKDSSLVSVLTVIDLTKRMTIAAVELHGWLVPGLACAGLYLALSLPLSELARRLERRLARDQRPVAL